MPSLFALGIQQSITLQLRGEGMSMARFISSLKIASLSFIRDLKKLKLTALSLAVIVATGAQTAGSALLPYFSSHINRPTQMEQLDNASSFGV